MFGQIMNAGFPLFAYTPFGYFNYDPTPGDISDWGCALTDSCKNDEHNYVLVITKDEGPLVYNPVNGNFIGRYNDLMQNMGCEVQQYKKPFFSVQPQRFKLEAEMFNCTLKFNEQLLDSISKKNSTQQLSGNYYKEPTNENAVIVSSVLDGDTIKLSNGQTVRLIGLNAAESGQSCSSEATDKLKEFILGKEVILEQDVDDKDQYGRLLRYIYVDNKFVNLEMVRLGLAHKYEYGSNMKYSSKFEQAEVEAKENKGCLWKTS
jgi:micrococcal nuclease